MRILYITRKFPPSIGGMQRQSYEFYNALKEKEEVFLVSWGHSQKFLPFFLAIAAVKGAYHILRHKADVVQVGDMVLAPLGFMFKLFFRRTVFAMSHGKDTYFNNALYQYCIPGFAKRLDGIICVSDFLKQVLVSRGLDPGKLFVVNNGMNAADYTEIRDKIAAVNEIGLKYGIDLENKKIILSVSRLVKRKGLSHFVKNIFPHIVKGVPDAVLLLAGEDAGRETRKEKDAITEIAKRLNIDNRVFFLGNIRDRGLLGRIYSISDVLIMPNIVVKGESEGFGIVALEASVSRVPVIAFSVGGIPDAVKNGENGILVKKGDNDGFAQAVERILIDEKTRMDLGNKAREFVKKNYDWNVLMNRYVEILKKARGSRRVT